MGSNLSGIPTNSRQGYIDGIFIEWTDWALARMIAESTKFDMHHGLMKRYVEGVAVLFASRKKKNTVTIL